MLTFRCLRSIHRHRVDRIKNGSAFNPLRAQGLHPLVPGDLCIGSHQDGEHPIRRGCPTCGMRQLKNVFVVTEFFEVPLRDLLTSANVHIQPFGLRGSDGSSDVGHPIVVANFGMPIIFRRIDRLSSKKSHARRVLLIRGGNRATFPCGDGFVAKETKGGSMS